MIFSFFFFNSSNCFSISSFASDLPSKSFNWWLIADWVRNNLSDDQKKEYSKLFEGYFLKSFANRLSEYTDPKINVEGSKKLNEKYTIVSSVLVATDKRPEVKIDWRIYTKNPDEPLIRDLIIEGLSLARTLKEEFNSIIQSNDGNIYALFTNLKEFINK